MTYKIAGRLKGRKRWLTLQRSITADMAVKELDYNLKRDEEDKLQWEYIITAESL